MVPFKRRHGNPFYAKYNDLFMSECATDHLVCRTQRTLDKKCPHIYLVVYS